MSCPWPPDPKRRTGPSAPALVGKCLHFETLESRILLSAEIGVPPSDPFADEILRDRYATLESQRADSNHFSAALLNEKLQSAIVSALDGPHKKPQNTTNSISRALPLSWVLPDVTLLESNDPLSHLTSQNSDLFLSADIDRLSSQHGDADFVSNRPGKNNESFAFEIEVDRSVKNDYAEFVPDRPRDNAYISHVGGDNDFAVHEEHLLLPTSLVGLTAITQESTTSQYGRADFVPDRPSKSAEAPPAPNDTVTFEALIPPPDQVGPVIGTSDDDTFENSGVDTEFQGLGGNDTYQFIDDWGADIVTEAAGGGVDTLDFSRVSSNLILNPFAVAPAFVAVSGNNTAAAENFEAIIGGRGVNTLDLLSSTANLTVSATGDLRSLTVTNGTDSVDITNLDEVDLGLGTNVLDFSAVSEDLVITFQGVGTVSVYDGVRTVSFQNVQSIIRGAGDDRYVFANLNNTIMLMGPDAGSDTVDFGDIVGDDLIFNITSTGVALGGTTYDDIENLVGGSGNDSFVFDTDQDSLPGFIDGGGGNDRLDYSSDTGGIFVDLGAKRATGTLFIDNIESVTGGIGDDTIVGDEQDNFLDGGDGVDTVSYAAAVAGVIVDLDGGTGAGAGADTLIDIENVVGSRFDDVLTGNLEQNFVQGGAGDDIIEGGDGDDMLVGGTGNDTVSYRSASDGVTVNLAQQTNPQDTINAGFDTLSEFENILGSNFIDTLTGDGNANTIEGGLGIDILTGGGGNNTVSYESDAASVVVDLATGVAPDSLTDFDNVIGSMIGGDTITGNVNDNVIRVVAGSNVIDGGGGTNIVRIDAGELPFGDPDDFLNVDTTFVDNTLLSTDVIDELVQVLADWAEFARDLEAYEENAALLPWTSSSMGSVAAFGSVLQQLYDDFEMASQSFTTTGDVVTFLRDWNSTLVSSETGLDEVLVAIDTNLLDGGINAANGQLSFDLVFTAARDSLVSLDQASTLTDQGVFLDTGWEFMLSTDFSLDFSFGVDPGLDGQLGMGGDDQSFIQVNSLTAGASAAATAPLSANLRVGFLDASVDAGAVALDGDVDILINGGAPIFDLGMGVAGLVDDIVVVNGDVSGSFTISVDPGFGGEIPQGTTIDISTASNFFTDPAEVTGLDDLADFVLASPNELLGSLDQLGEWFASLAESALLDLQIPFTDDTSIGDVLDFASAFRDDVLRHLVHYDGLQLASDFDGLTEDVVFSLVVETTQGETSYQVKLPGVPNAQDVSVDDFVIDIAEAVRVAIGDSAIADQLEVFQENDETGATRIGFRAAAGASDVIGVHVPLIENETLSALGDRLHIPASVLQAGQLGNELQFELNVDGAREIVTVVPRVGNDTVEDLVADIQQAIDEQFGVGVRVALDGSALNEISFTALDDTVGTVRLLGVLDATALVPGELSFGLETASFPTAQQFADQLSKVLSDLAGSTVDIDVLLQTNADGAREISFDLDWNRLFELVSVPIDFGLDLGDFASVDSSTTLGVAGNLDFDMTFGVLLAPTDDIVISPPVFVPDLPQNGVLSGDAGFGFDILQDNFAEEIRLSTQLAVTPDTDGRITIDGGAATTFTWNAGDGTLTDDLSFALRITDPVGGDSEFVFGTLLAFDAKTNDDEPDSTAALGQDLQNALNLAFGDDVEDIAFTVTTVGNQLQITATSATGTDGRIVEFLFDDEYLVATIDDVSLSAVDTEDNDDDPAGDPIENLVADLQAAIDAALMDAGIEPVPNSVLGLGNASLAITENQSAALSIVVGDESVPDNGVLRADLRFMLQLDGGDYIFGIVEAADTIENETADDPIAALAADVERALQDALAGQDIDIVVEPSPILGFDLIELAQGESSTAATPASGDGVLEDDLAFRLNAGTGDIFTALRAAETMDNLTLGDLATDLENSINEAFSSANDPTRVSVAIDSDDRLVITADVGAPTIDFTDNSDTNLRLYATSASQIGSTLDVMFFSPAVVAVDAGNRLSLFAPAVAQEGSSDSASKVLGRRLDIHIPLDLNPGTPEIEPNRAYTELGLNSSPIPFDGVLSDTAQFSLVVDGTQLDVTVAEDNSNTSLDDLLVDINDAIAVAIAASGEPTIEMEARRVMLGENIDGEAVMSAGNRIEFVASNARSVEILSQSEGTLNDVAINELGFDPDNSSEVRVQSGEFFLSDTSLSGELILSADDISASAQFGFGLQDGDGLALGVSAAGSGEIVAGASLSLVDPVTGGSRVTLGTLWDTLGTADLTEIRMLVDADITGTANIDLEIQPDIPLATPLEPATVELDLEIFNWLDSPPQVSDTRDDDGELLDDGVPVTVTVSGPDLNFYEAFANLSFSDVISALNDVVDYLRDVQGVGDSAAFAAILDTKMPLLNQSVSDLLDVSERFALFVEDLENNPTGSVQLLEAVIEDLLGLPEGSDLVAFSLDADNEVVLRLDLEFGTGIEESFGLDLQLEDYVSRVADGVPFLDGVRTLVGVSSTGNLDVEVDATFQLSLGLALTDSGVDAFLYTGEDGTALSIGASAEGSNLDFTAQLGPFGFFVDDGTAQLNGAFEVVTVDDGDGRFNLGEDTISVSASVVGGASADLPLFFPDESTPIGNNPDTNSMVITFGNLSDFLTGDGGDNSVTIDTPNLTEFPTPTLIGMLSNPEYVLDGLDALLGTIQDALNGEIYGIELPFIGDQLEPAGQFVGDFREDVLAYLSLKLREGGLNPIDLVQETLYNVFGGRDDGDPLAVQILGFDINQLGVDGAGSIVAANDFDIENFDQQARFLLSIDSGTPELVAVDREDIVDGEGDDLDDLIAALQVSLVARGLDQKVEAGRNGNRLLFTALGGNEISINKAHAVAIQIGGLKVGALDVLKDFDEVDGGLIDINDVFVSGFGLVDTYGQFDMNLGQTFTYNQPIDFDFGLPMLGFDLDAGIELEFEWALDFGFGVDQSQGFYFATKDNLPHDDGDPDATPRTDELSITLSATLTGGEDNADGQAMFEGQLGFLVLEGIDNNSFLSAEILVDLADPNDDGFLTFSEMVASSTGVSDVLTASLDVTADVMMDLTVKFDGLGLDATLLPEISLGLDIDWLAQTSTGAQDGPDIGTPDVNFRNIELDLGSFIADFAGPFLDDIGAVLEPLGWLLDRDTGLLYQRLPVISDLAGETVSLKRLAELLDTRNRVTPFLNAVEEIYFLVDLVGQAAQDARNAGGEGLTLQFGDLSFGNLGGLSNLSDAERTMSGDTTDIDDISNDQNTPQSTRSFTKNVTKPSGMLSFDILQPSNIIKLLVGDPAVDLVSYSLPPFGFDFEYLQRFPIYPPLFATLRGFFSSTIELGFGYDTYGLSLFEASDNPQDLIGGFYVNDLNADGLDIPEVTLVGGIAAGASLDVLVASAGVEGGIDATIYFDLNDPNIDGKVRLSEMAANILINSLNPLAIFDTTGKVDAFLRAYVEVLFGLWSKDYEIARVTLATFEIPYERLPIVAQDMGGGELVVNMGSSSASRIHGNLDDGNEQVFAKWQDGSVFVWGNGLEERFAQRFIGVEKIVVNAGAGDDFVDFSRLANSGIAVEIHGGTGNDVLIGGAGANLITGGEGDDIITGGSGADELIGGLGDDTIVGGTGRDILMGGAGDDDLTGDAGNDELDGGVGNDLVDGGAGDDTYLFASGWGDDEVRDVSGNDSWDFSATTTDIVFSLGRNLELETLAESLGNSVVTPGFGIENITGGRGGDIFDIFQTGTEQIVLNGAAGSDRYTVYASDPAVPIEIALQDIGNSWDRDLWRFLGTSSGDFIEVTSEGINGGDDVSIALLENPDTDGLNAVGFTGDEVSDMGVLLGTVALADGDFDGVARFELTIGDEPPVLVAVASKAVGGTKSTDDLIDALNQSLMDNGLGDTVLAERDGNQVSLSYIGSEAGVELTIAPVIIGPGIEALQVNAMDGNDVILVSSTRDDMAVIVRGEEGQDSIAVGDGTVDGISGGAITGPLVIDGGEETDRLVINDALDDSANFGTLTNQFVTGLDMDIQVEYRGIEDMMLLLGQGSDEFTIVNTTTFDTLVHGGGGNDQINVEGIEGETNVIGGNDSDTFSVGSTARPTVVELDLSDVDTVAELVDALNLAFAGAGLDAKAGRTGDFITIETNGAVKPATLEIGGGVSAELLGFGSGDSATGTEERLEARLVAVRTPDFENEAFTGTIAVELTINLEPGGIGGGVIDDINANLFIQGDDFNAPDPFGVDTAFIDDSGATLDNTGNLTATQLTLNDLLDGQDQGVSIQYATLETFNVRLGSGDDVVNVTGTSAGQGRLLGDTFGDIGAPNVLGTVIESGTGNATFNVSSDAPLNLGNVDGIQGALTVRAGSDLNVLNVSDFEDPTGDDVRVTDNSIVGLGPAPIFYDAVGAFGGGIHVFAGTGDDQFAVESILGGSVTLLHTSLGNDSLTTGALPADNTGILAVFGELGDDTFNAAESELGVFLFGDIGEVIFTQDDNGEALMQSARSLVAADGGRDTLIGGSGNDVLIGGANSDDLAGNGGNDGVLGDGGQVTYRDGRLFQIETIDPFIGAPDSLSGGAGNDTIIGGAGFDLLSGSLAEDILIFEYGRVTFDEQGQAEFVVTLGQRPLDLAASTMFDLYLKDRFLVSPYFVGEVVSDRAPIETGVIDVSTGLTFYGGSFRDVQCQKYLAEVGFELNSAILTSESDVYLRQAAEYLSGLGDVIVQISGHADSIGSSVANQRLSLDRAQSVVEMLVKYDVNPAILRATGYGEERPVGDNATKEGRAVNRRVEIEIADDGACRAPVAEADEGGTGLGLLALAGWRSNQPTRHQHTARRIKW